MGTIEKKLVAERRNLYGGMAETIASCFPGLRKEAIKESLGGFPSVSHRLEEVATIRGVRFINDSKATNVNACWFALESMHHPVIWIAGGQDHCNDYSVLKELAGSKVKALICLGTDNTNLITSFRETVPVLMESNQMEEAVNMAYVMAGPGDVVLLSPASPSFDLFENYADRGRRFSSAVRDL